MSESPIDLAGIFQLEPLDSNRYRGDIPKTTSQWVFGGHIIGQAMAAACRTVTGRLPHSLHSHFLKPGDPLVPIIYRVEVLRDGRTYSFRRVTAIQCANAICSIMVSFQIEEQGAFDHQDEMPYVSPPERLAAEQLAKQPVFVETPEFIRRNYGIELLMVETGRYFGQKLADGHTHVWMKTAAKLPDNPTLHVCALAYVSDYPLLDAVTARYGSPPFDKWMIRASLDHAMWFHRAFRADEWLLYAQESPSAHAGRGLTRGLIFEPGGSLVATVAQEGSVRERR
ncbi:acyl-CoA thioesterase II [Bradyrhizobium sp. BEA-2-5]|uniref:acyl-CoA thioesterase n=1 Tax=Bradyrhizobium sp. BEA-2-5 TaxID=3080015 RepID=UPI00293F2331|nr:acyl-CoA thioesterase II [Bradyrhizobium sp. BEA-2-5]WOH80371.1 acyl-CoA thioesterase II [Bradyrhizobium sp. BEA-2-5]